LIYLKERKIKTTITTSTIELFNNIKMIKVRAYEFAAGAAQP